MGRSENSLSRHKEKAWKAFSLYIRTRDCLKTMDRIDMGKCVTCSKVYPRTGVGCLQAGHFLPGRSNSILFDERGVHGQCWQCNHYDHGRPAEYLIFMQHEYGQEVIDDLLRKKTETLKYSVPELVEIERKYTELTEKLLRPKMA